jgi:hypothetical protein
MMMMMMSPQAGLSWKCKDDDDSKTMATIPGAGMRPLLRAAAGEKGGVTRRASAVLM